MRTKASTAALDPLARSRSSSGDAFRATRLAVKNCRKGSEAELGFKCQGNDHEDRDKNYK